MRQSKEANNFSQELLSISLTKSCHFKLQSVLHLKAETLSFQRVKRIKALKWGFSHKWSPWRSEEEIESLKNFPKTLGGVLKHEKNLRKLFLDVEEHLEPHGKHLLHLAQGLKKAKGLHSIAFKAQNSNLLAKQGLYDFIKGLTRFCFLKNFLLNLHWSDQISDTDLACLSRSIKKMLFLKDIDIWISNLPHVTDKGVSRVNSSLKCLKRIENVTLMIRECSQVTDRSFEKMNFERLIFLRSICLDFGSCPQLSDKSLDLIGQSLQRLLNLQNMKIEMFECSRVGNLGLHYIWKLMKNLPSLRRITLNFTKCSITDAGFHDMKKTLKCLAGIQKFHIELNSCSEISDNGLIDLCKVLEKWVSLQNISVSFGSCSKITDTGVKKVIDCMKKLTHLRKIGFDFAESMNITDNSLNYVSQFLESQVSLEKIILFEVRMHGTTDEGAENFYEEILNLRRQRPNLEIKYRD